MFAQKMRWLALRDEQRGDHTYRCSLFVTNLNDGGASLTLFGYQVAQDVLSSDGQRAEISSEYSGEDHFAADRKLDLINADQSGFPYTNGTLGAALEWIEMNGFVADMFVLAELVRALDE